MVEQLRDVAAKVKNISAQLQGPGFYWPYSDIGLYVATTQARLQGIEYVLSEAIDLLENRKPPERPIPAG